MPQTYYGDEISRAGAIGVTTRGTFIARTYTHLLAAIALFLAIEVFLFSSGYSVSIARAMLSVNWLLVLGAFVIVSWFASSAAASATSLGAQYGALGLFVTAEAIIFVPMLYIANSVAPGAIQSAGALTAIGFAGLTAIAFA